LEITVLSKQQDFDMSLFLAGMVRFGEIDVTSVSEMVDKVIAASIGADELITRLNILGHGSKDSMSVGDDEVMIINLTSFRPLLRRLQYRFDDRGSVFLQQCLVDPTWFSCKDSQRPSTWSPTPEAATNILIIYGTKTAVTRTQTRTVTMG
jgi:hypothetical protein